MKPEQNPKGTVSSPNSDTSRLHKKIVEWVYSLLGSYDRMEIFQVESEERSAHGDHQTDSDEFDHFFD